MDQSKRADYTPTNLTQLHQKLFDVAEKSWLPSCRDISNNVMPHLGHFQYSDKQEETYQRGRDLVSSTAIASAERLAAGMQAGINSPALQWYKYTLGHPDLSKVGAVRSWLDLLEKIAARTLSKSNFYTSTHQGFEEIAAFGTLAIINFEHPTKAVHYQLVTAGQYALSADPFGITDTFTRKLSISAKQAAQMFGEKNLSQTSRNQLETNPYEYIDLIHIILPNDNAKNKDGWWNMPWREFYFEPEGNQNKFLRMAGYREFPVLVGRWKKVGSNIYGIGPCHRILGDVKSQTAMIEDRMTGLDMNTRPPVVGPADFMDFVDLNPGGYNPVDDPNAMKITPIYNVRFPFAEVTAAIGEINQIIERALFSDLFLMIEQKPNITATEILERKEEKLFQLGPVIHRIENDVLDMGHRRLLSILEVQGKIPPPPRVLQEARQSNPEAADFKVEYVGQLAQAQKAVAAKKMTATVERTLQAAEAWPDVLDNIDSDNYIRTLGEINGADSEIFNDQDEVKQIREQRRAAQEKQQQLEQQLAAGQVLADSAEKLGKTPLGDQSALEAVMAEMTGNPFEGASGYV